MAINIGDEVVFRKEVIRRSGHSDFATTFRGVVVELDGRTCCVEVRDQFLHVPVANLVTIRPIKDWRTGKVEKLVLDLP